VRRECYLEELHEQTAAAASAAAGHEEAAQIEFERKIEETLKQFVIL
jgi:hypothetical protein